MSYAIAGKSAEAELEIERPVSGDAATQSAAPSFKLATAQECYRADPRVSACDAMLVRLRRGRGRFYAMTALSLLFGLLCWHWATLYKFNYFINFENVPAPASVWSAFLVQLGDPEFYVHLMVSMRRILIGFGLAAVIGVVIGTVTGRSAMARAAVLPYIEILRPIPAVAWIPLAILMWPTEESSIVYITFLGALFPIILNTVQGVEQTPPVLLRAAKSLGASPLQIFWYVVLPSALPSISTGLAVGMGVSWFSLLAGEIISGQYGIGYFTWNAYSLINYPDIVVGMLIIGGLGTLSTYLVRVAMGPALRWQRSIR